MTEFVIPGQPVGWRQNHTARGKSVQSYLVKPATIWRRDAVAQIRRKWGGREPMTGPISLHVVGVFCRPAYFDCEHVRSPCSCPPEKLDGSSRPHTSKPDATNVHKLAEDALVRAVVMVDDQQVSTYSGDMRYAAAGEAPHVRIVVIPVPNA